MNEINQIQFYLNKFNSICKINIEDLTYDAEPRPSYQPVAFIKFGNSGIELSYNCKIRIEYIFNNYINCVVFNELGYIKDKFIFFYNIKDDIIKFIFDIKTGKIYIFTYISTFIYYKYEINNENIVRYLKNVIQKYNKNKNIMIEYVTELNIVMKDKNKHRIVNNLLIETLTHNLIYKNNNIYWRKKYKPNEFSFLIFLYIDNIRLLL